MILWQWRNAVVVWAGGVEYAADMYDTVLEVDALLIQTEWKQFRLPNWSLLLKLMNNPVIIDGRNIYDAEELQHLGFDYYLYRKMNKLKALVFYQYLPPWRIDVFNDDG